MVTSSARLSDLADDEFTSSPPPVMAVVVEQERCRHDLAKAWCGYCNPRTRL